MTFGEYSGTVLDGLTVRPRTIAKYRYHLDKHLLPRFGNRKLADISTDDVARLVAEMERGIWFKHIDGRYIRSERKAGFAGSTIAGTLSTLGLIMRKAKRKGLVPANPVADLERGERPKLRTSEKRVLGESEIGKLLASGEAFRPLLAALTFAGLRLGEALGLQWQDIGADGFIHVRRQLGRNREVADIKTAAGRRDVVLMPQLAAVLTAHKLASRHSQETDFVFAAAAGRGRDHRSTSRGIECSGRRSTCPPDSPSSYLRVSR